MILAVYKELAAIAENEFTDIQITIKENALCR